MTDGGTGKWRVPGVPHRGWECVEIEDLEEPCHLCQMCEVQIVRYVHTMFHPDYATTLEVGCICAGHMEQNIVGAREREASFKRRLSRRASWLRRRWRISHNGNEFINTQDGFNVVVFHSGESWSARFLYKPTGFVRFSQRPYGSADAAKLAAFDAMMHYKTRCESAP
jgi:hypothetical protein